MKKLHGFILFVILCFALPLVADALETDTHKAINKYIAENTLNGFSLDSYLKKQLGITKGIEEEFKSTETKKAWDWVQFGGEFEDAPPWTLPYLRSKNHFHNPINEQGFSGIWDTEFLSGMSAINWVLSSPNTQSPGGYYSWADVRSYYLKALTLGTKTDRDTNFAQTFRGLGQLMHLVQDMSVPEHTRNDGHYVPYIAYEDWVKTSVRNNGVPMPDSNKGHFFTGSISSIKSFMDTNTFTGSNPEVTAYSTIGLSEFSNANFFSDDSIFTGFTYPSITGASKWVDDTNNRMYLEKTSEGVPVKHLATVSWLYFYRWQKFPQYNEWLPLGLDSKVYSDYAALLLPRAVGYSAGLLNYFFREKMDMIKESSNSNQYIIKNLSNENMFGTFSLYYDDANDNRYLAASWRNLAINANSQSSSITFTAPSFPAPKEKGKYVLVFQGTFGNEIGAVMGKVVEGLCAGKWVYYDTLDYCGANEYCNEYQGGGYANCWDCVSVSYEGSYQVNDFFVVNPDKNTMDGNSCSPTLGSAYPGGAFYDCPLASPTAFLPNWSCEFWTLGCYYVHWRIRYVWVC